MGRFTRDHYLRFWSQEIDRLHPTGRDEMRGICPVHAGDNPETLVVHLDNGFAHCFKCHNQGESWTMVDFARARYGMDAESAHAYVNEVTGMSTSGQQAVIPWTLPFPKPLVLTADPWRLSLLARRIEEMQAKFDSKDEEDGPGWKAVALYVYEECRAVKIRFRHSLTGKKRMIWLALTDKGGWARLRTTGREAGLYRAGALHGKEEVWLLNGEKAVDRAVAEWGIAATCLPHGEDKWKAEYLASFAGFKLVFLPPDNDATGAKHARRIGAELMRAGIETRIVTLDGLPEKGDVWDFIEAGGTLEQARQLALGSPLADPDYVPPKKERAEPPPAPSAEEAALAREGPDLIESYGYTDMDNAQRLLAVADGNLAHSTRLEEPWLAYNGVRWKNQAEHMVEIYAERAMRLLALQANQRDDDRTWKYAQKNLNASGIHAMIRLARRSATRELDDFDREPWLINCPSGVYDAERGEWREHRREDRLTRVFPYDYDPKLGPPKLFLRSLFEWLGGTADMGEGELERIERLIAYMRRWLACSATGDTREKGFGVVHGEKGNNGKTTFLATAQDVFGEYAVTISPSDLTRNAWKNQNNTNANIARSRGARAIFAGEPPAGEKFDQSVIKMLTQSEVPVSAVFKGRQPFQFLPSAKIWLEANKVPSFDTDDPAFLRRMHLFHFAREFQIEHAHGLQLRERLRAEQPAIFTWIVDGIPEYREMGLARPQEAAAGLKEIRDEQARDDGLEPFLEEFFDTGPKLWCRLSVIEELHRKYSERYKSKPLPRNVLSRRLTERLGIERGNDMRDHHTPAWLKGLAPKPGAATATVGAVLWGYDGNLGAARAMAAAAAQEEERELEREREDEYWNKWPRN